RIMTGLHREKQGAQHPETDSSVEGGVYGALTPLLPTSNRKAIIRGGNHMHTRIFGNGLSYPQKRKSPASAGLF
ncbi:hypothetical protein ACQKFE_12705, partial [Stutzerimonas stutzeri]|uniref:hypothetical protein n=1 Tax=Stutzerimonas stutzeri TaxID=316 RepID=UPI003D07470F